MLVVGLTGGIGAGKSTVAAELGELGAVVIDVDAIGRQVLEPDGRAHGAVLAEFGTAISDADGAIDRAALGAIVFDDPRALVRLTDISHPAINAELADRLRGVAAERPDAVVVLDMAILVESDLGRADTPHPYTFVVSVEADAAERLARAVARGMAVDDARRRMASQADDSARGAVADVVIVNDGDEDALHVQVRELWERLDRLARGPGDEPTGEPGTVR